MHENKDITELPQYMKEREDMTRLKDIKIVPWIITGRKEKTSLNKQQEELSIEKIY